ncbi:uncharacterized protein LOC106161755 [Lingula anatina]|uniref:Uncharacterized protein LOC106161755 n=1 Tax=Lingula anatina TaxID=7574 RepID=A0A1S3I7K4_LINAN|nr:uncharacterized protein LOC106161755 [Lingula anatina]|eukprot:XP_013394232.1 uncharacterized protein LOC106161755 [Lingula anatina]
MGSPARASDVCLDMAAFPNATETGKDTTTKVPKPPAKIAKKRKRSSTSSTHDSEEVDYTSMTIKELKNILKSRGLKVGGSKMDLVERLTKPISVIDALNQKKYLSVADVHQLLSCCGVKNPEKVNKCLKRGILLGHVKLTGKKSLKTVIAEGNCASCEEEMAATVKDILYQKEYGGSDYENGGQEASVKCETEDCGQGMYVTGVCYGEACFDSGKFHNHCTECPDFGECLGDYREAHCEECGGHYYAGGSGSCPCEESDSDGDWGFTII